MAEAGRRRGGATSEETWFVLHHRPGPALPDGESVFAQPAFAEHVAFLKRLNGLGLLVAAGPLPEQPGAGMTIVRVPAGADVDVDDLAARDDRSVAQGLLTVEVTPWAVAFNAIPKDSSSTV
jgi:uncharacterized protein YciI